MTAAQANQIRLGYLARIRHSKTGVKSDQKPVFSIGNSPTLEVVSDIALF